MLYTISDAGIRTMATHFTLYPVFRFKMILVARHVLDFFLEIKSIVHNQAISIPIQKKI